MSSSRRSRRGLTFHTHASIHLSPFSPTSASRNREMSLCTLWSAHLILRLAGDRLTHLWLTDTTFIFRGLKGLCRISGHSLRLWTQPSLTKPCILKPASPTGTCKLIWGGVNLTHTTADVSKGFLILHPRYALSFNFYPSSIIRRVLMSHDE